MDSLKTRDEIFANITSTTYNRYAIFIWTGFNDPTVIDPFTKVTHFAICYPHLLSPVFVSYAICLHVLNDYCVLMC